MTIAAMSKITRTITKADTVAAENLRALWDAAKKKNPTFTQEAAALDLGLTQSAVSQYLLGRIALSVEATLKFARLLRVDPARIRPDIQELLRDQSGGTDDLLGGVLSHLPTDEQRQVLDFLKYKVERAEANIANDKLASYLVMINKMLADLNNRRNNGGKKSS